MFACVHMYLCVYVHYVLSFGLDWMDAMPSSQEMVCMQLFFVFIMDT